MLEMILFDHSTFLHEMTQKFMITKKNFFGSKLDPCLNY